MSNYHTYSDDDISYIKSHYQTETATELAHHCGVSFNAMNKELQRLGLVPPRDGRRWSQEEIDKFRDYVLSGESLDGLVEKTGRTEKAVKDKARQLGLKIKGVASNWRVEDLDYLRRNWGRVSLETLAKKLGRTENAIVARAFILKLPPCYTQSEDIPLSEFSRDTGISSVRITRTLAVKFDFPIKSKKPGKTRYYFYVDIERILPWLESHQSLYSAAKIPLYYFGEEPDWLAEKRKADSYLESETVDGKWKAEHWSEADLRKLKDMVANRKSQAEIANELGRTEGAVRAKLAREGLSHSSPKFWRGRDFKAIQDGAENKSDAELASELGRTKSAVIHHRNFLGINRVAMAEQRLREAEDYVKSHWQEQSDYELASNLGRTKRNIKTIRLSLGLKRGGSYGQES